MTSTTTQPTTAITNIADRAMLVGLTIKLFNAVKTDKKITEEVAAQHGSEVTMGRYAKSVIAKDSLDKLRKLSAEIRQEHYRRTLPWSEDGARILTQAGYFDYAEWMRGAESTWQPAVSEFLNSWDRYVSEARVKLNGLFDPSDYPTLEQLKNKFAFRWSVRPVPVADDFRVALGASEVSAIRSDIEYNLRNTVQEAMRDVWTRMRDVVGKMAERLKAYDPNSPSSAPFRDSLVSNISDLLEILPSLNLTADPAVTDFTARIRELCQHDAQRLRDDMFAREDTAKRAEQIYSAMSAFIS